MNSASLSLAWFQLLALLAVEVSLTAVVVALLWRLCPSTAWRRTFCQMGIVATFVIAVCELSGSARSFASWPAGILTKNHRATATATAKESLPAIGAAIPNSPQANPTPVMPAAAPAVALPPGFREATRFDSMSVQVSRATQSGYVGEAGPAVAQATVEPPTVKGLQPRLPSHPSAAIFRNSEVPSDLLCFLCGGLVWAIGCALTGARVCLAHCLFFVFRFRRRPITDAALRRRTEELARGLGISRRVRVIESAGLTSPIACGLLTPTIGLPSDFGTRFDAARQDAILAHELAHLSAHDPVWCLLADAATIPFWWHPGIWWLRRRLHLANEMMADEASLLVADGPRVLAECLVELGSRLAQPAPLGQLRVSGFRSHLGCRVQRLVHLEGQAWSPPPRLRSALATIFGPLALVALLIFSTAWATPRAVTKGESIAAMKLNWKRSLAALSLLTAVEMPNATPVAAQSEITPPPAPVAARPAQPAPAASNPTPAEAPAPAPGDLQTAAPVPTVPNSDAEAAFRRRYGLAAAASPTPGPGIPAPAPVPVAPAKRGARLQARLEQILLPQIAFDGLPLGEVLRVLSEESIKSDPGKAGVNFLINPNSPPVALTTSIDPATGLPVAAAPTEAIDMSSVVVKFNLPLRNVSMKDVLDAIVTVADHPIEYTIEDYAVIFAAKPSATPAMPVALPTPMLAPQPPRTVPRPAAAYPQMFVDPGDHSAAQTAPPRPRLSNAELAAIKPRTFNIDFGSGSPSKQAGPAAAGKPGDFWNAVSVGFNDHHTESALKFADGDSSPIEVEMINLGGGWSFSGVMGVKSPMLDTYNYPTGNKGGNSKVILHQVPPGKYTLYAYGHGPNGPYYGDYTVTVGSRNYGRKQTTHGADAGKNTKWVEGSQYVKFPGVKVELGEEVEILIQPGGQVTDPGGRTFSDAMICGLQLIPVK